jgi:hypothetical protein
LIVPGAKSLAQYRASLSFYIQPDIVLAKWLVENKIEAHHAAQKR